MSTPARCAALTAMMDLRGRRVAQGSPAPAPASRPVRCNATLSAGAPGDVAEDALQWAAEGFSAFKLKLGIGNDVAAVRAVREALGPAASIRVDANASWDVETAKRTLAELEPLDIELVEQPVKTISETLALASCTSIPIAADESVGSRAEAEDAVATGAFALAGLKLSKVGGPEAAIEIAAVLPCFLSSALDGPVGIAAAAAVAQTLQEGIAEQDTAPAHGLATQRLFSSTIASMECELRGGMLHLPEGPGLGVEIEEAALQAHRL
jgi:o-succinylbenzoate synthase